MTRAAALLVTSLASRFTPLGSIQIFDRFKLQTLLYRQEFEAV